MLVFPIKYLLLLNPSKVINHFVLTLQLIEKWAPIIRNSTVM
jgi:hypothetical protein